MKCKLVQWWVSFHLDDSAAPPSWVERHLAQCPACRAYQQSQASLSQGLRAQAAQIRETAPPFLKTRVLAAVAAQSDKSSDPVRAFTRRRSLSIGAAIACALAGGLLLLWHPQAPVEQASNPLPATAWLAQGTNQLAKLANIEAPLQKEMQLAVSDAKNALWAVVDGVLPDKMIAAVRNNEQ
jgi:predicted anti-sigma-YlaC factor YlaD